MLTDGRKTIGIFMNKADTNFQDTVQYITQQRAKEMGCDVFYFFTVGYRESANFYDVQEKSMFSFVPLEKLDGILVTPDSYDMPGFREALFDMLEKRANCPIVCIRDSRSVYDSVYTDENKAIRPLLAHLLDDHGFRKVCFESGYAEHPDGSARLQCYKEEMAKRGIPLPPNAIYYGSMWTRGADLAYHHFFDDPENIPEAIVCANDYMALALSDEIQEHGYRVPQDVVVTGFDNIFHAAYTSPSLTTVGQDYPLMINTAMDILDQRIQAKARGEELPPAQHIGLGADMKIRESCGCNMNKDLSYLKDEVRKMAREMREIQTRETAQTYFSIELNSADDYEGIHQAIFKKLEDTPAIRDFYLGLFVDEDGKVAGHITPKVRLVSVIQDKKDKGSSNLLFDRENLLPKLANRDEPQAFHVLLLHQRENTYGYTVMQLEDGQTPSMFYTRWNVNISLALRNLDDQNKLKALYEERRRSSVTDALTGLYNRRGLDEQLVPHWDDMCHRGDRVCFFSMDLDNLKAINDTLGHQAGDDALCVVAQAMRAAMPEDAIPVRNGGDEYLLFIPHCDEHGEARFRTAFQAALLEKGEGRAFTAGASMGSAVITLKPGVSMAQCIRESDQAMYAEKKLRHEVLARHAKTLR